MGLRVLLYILLVGILTWCLMIVQLVIKLLNYFGTFHEIFIVQTTLSLIVLLNSMHAL